MQSATGVWEYYYNRLYMYKTRIHDNFSASTTLTVANAMEMAARLSYTAFADGTNLRTGEEFLVEFPSDESKMAWKRVWKVFERLGLRVTVGLGANQGTWGDQVPRRPSAIRPGK